MRLVSESELLELARQMERTAKLIRSHGPLALKRAHDWSGASSLRSSTHDPGRGKGHTPDPTGDAGTAARPDPNSELLILLTSEAGRAFDAVVTLESRVSGIAQEALSETQRKSVGWCGNQCGRYCDGTEANRLRAGLCPACDQKARRDAVACVHRRVLTQKGGALRTCCDCGVQLTDAGVVK